MAEYVTTDTELTLIADAIRTKGGTSASLTYPAGFVSAIENIPSGGGGGSAEDIIRRHQSEISYDVSEIGDYAFYGYSTLTNVSFSQCVTIGQAAFNNCSYIELISFPECTSIGRSAFAWAFKYYYSTSGGPLYFPKCEYIGYGAFTYTGFSSIILPECMMLDSSAFTNCSYLTSIELPKCLIVGENAFYGCCNLTSLSLPNCTNIYNYAFRNCTKLKSVFLLGSSVATLSSSYAFSSTAYAYIYVPSSLVTTYKKAANWSKLSTYIRNYEEYFPNN